MNSSYKIRKNNDDEALWTNRLDFKKLDFKSYLSNGILIKIDVIN